MAYSDRELLARLIECEAGGEGESGIVSDVPCIVAADDLAPSETVQLDKSLILGFITSAGSANSHTAILARTMGIPAIIGADAALTETFLSMGIDELSVSPSSVLPLRSAIRSIDTAALPPLTL